MKTPWLWVLGLLALGLYLLRKRRSPAQGDGLYGSLDDGVAIDSAGEWARAAAMGAGVAEASLAADRGVQQMVARAVSWPTAVAPTIVGATNREDIYGWGWYELAAGGFVNIHTGEGYSPGTRPPDARNAYDRGDAVRPTYNLDAAAVDPVGRGGLLIL
jgi:hypothetical protein